MTPEEGRNFYAVLERVSEFKGILAFYDTYWNYPVDMDRFLRGEIAITIIRRNKEYRACFHERLEPGHKLLASAVETKLGPVVD